MRASRSRLLVVPALAAATLATGCGGDSPPAAPEGPEGIARAVREYTAAQAGDDPERFCDALTTRAQASFSRGSGNGSGRSACVETVRGFADDLDPKQEGVREYQRFLDGRRDAAADPANLRVARTGDGVARVRVRLRGEPSLAVVVRREDGRWKADEVAETATLR